MFSVFNTFESRGDIHLRAASQFAWDYMVPVVRGPAGGGEVIVCRGLAPGGRLSAVGGESGRGGRGRLFFGHN